jgi:hypothetical protein
MTPDIFIMELNKNSVTRNHKSWNPLINSIKGDKKIKNLILSNISNLLTDSRLKKDQIKKILET